VQQGVKFEGEVGTIHQLTELNDLAKRKPVRYIMLNSFDKLVVTLIRQVKEFAVDVNAVDVAAKIQKLIDPKRSRQITKFKNDPGTAVTLVTGTLAGAEQFLS
jgi:hypothetical protein